METIYAIGPVQGPLLPLAPSESELSSCLHYGLQKVALGSPFSRSMADTQRATDVRR